MNVRYYLDIILGMSKFRSQASVLEFSFLFAFRYGNGIKRVYQFYPEVSILLKILNFYWLTIIF